jgi:hypothetical protein
LTPPPSIVLHKNSLKAKEIPLDFSKNKGNFFAQTPEEVKACKTFFSHENTARGQQNMQKNRGQKTE